MQLLSMIDYYIKHKDEIDLLLVYKIDRLARNTKDYLIINGDKNHGNRCVKVNPKYPLRGILFYRNGHKMTASSPESRTKYYPKYHYPKCRGLHMDYNIEEVDNKFINYVENIQINENIKEFLKVTIISNLDDTMKK